MELPGAVDRKGWVCDPAFFLFYKKIFSGMIGGCAGGQARGGAVLHMVYRWEA